ncbi:MULTISPECIES: hypothetical protein [Myroides]|uniref:hypothetical protein n=1 Tax=Myroides TaxID=76831 RepID=UPI001302F273|nr:hypothetical protein [Myroides phaeus]
MKKIGWILFICFLSLQNIQAQCAMCRASLETEEGGVKAEAVNDGIVYLMLFPYLLVGLALFFSYKVYKSKKVIKQ